MKNAWWLGDIRHYRRLFRSLILWLAIVTAVAIVGAMGYMVVEDFTFFQGLFMAVTVLSSVGIKEIHPMGVGGDAWTIVMAARSVAVIFGTVGVAAETIAQELTNGERKARRMQKTVDVVSGHYISCAAMVAWVRWWPGT